MGKDSIFDKLGDLAGDALEKVDTKTASKAVGSAIDAAQKAAGAAGKKAEPLVKKAKQAAPGLIDKAKSALGDDPKPAAGTSAKRKGPTTPEEAAKQRAASKREAGPAAGS